MKKPHSFSPKKGKTHGLRWCLLAVLLLSAIASEAADFYWDGGNSTLWSDPLNWHVGAQAGPQATAPPEANDNVFFNLAGPYTLDIDVNTAKCRNFSVGASNMLTVNSVSGNVELWVHGSFFLQTSTTWNYNRFVWFKANFAVTIAPNLNHFNRRIYFDDPNGVFDVVSPLLSYDNVVLQSGELTLQDGGNFGGFFATNSSAPTYNLNLNPSANNLVLFNDYVPGDPWSYAWSSVVPLVLNQDVNFEIECTGAEVYFSSQALDFSIVKMTHGGTAGFTYLMGADAGLQNSFLWLSFRGNATIRNDNRIVGMLEVTRGGYYQFEVGKTQDFIGSGTVAIITANTPPCAYTNFESGNVNCVASASSKFNNMVAPTTSLAYLAVRGVELTNTIPVIMATPGIDLGGANGWTLNNPGSYTFTWTGGGTSPSWFDDGNWNPGGSPGCLPSPIDDVRFLPPPSGGGKIVDVNWLSAQCKSMDWSSSGPGWNLTSSSVANRLMVNGSMSMPAAGNIANGTFIGLLYFGANPGGGTNTILSNTYRWRNDVHFDGCGGSWRTLDQFETSGLSSNIISFGGGGIIYLDQGFLEVSNQTVRSLAWYSRGNEARHLRMLNSTIELLGKENPNYNLFAWDFKDGHGQNNLTMQYGNDVQGSHIILYENASLGYRFASGQVLHRVTFEKPGRIHGSNIFRWHVHFKSDGTIGYPQNTSSSTASNIFRRQLRLEPGKAYVVEIGEEQQFIGNNSTIVTNGSCSEYTQIRSSQPSVSTKFTNLSAGTITMDYCILKDLDGTSGSHAPNFQCNNSLGFNLTTVPSDWNLTAPTAPAALYWVGGLNGLSNISWSDPANWSITPGALNNPSNCIPSPVTDAIFEDSGFPGSGSYVVEVDVCNAYVHNMIWRLTNSSGINVEFRDNNQVAYLWVYGYWDMCDVTNCGSLITNNYDAAISFETDGDPMDYLYMDPPLVFNSDLYFRGLNKTWVHRSDITTTKEEFLEAGRHHTGEHNLTVDRFTGYDDGILDIGDPSSPVFTLTGTAINTPLRYTFESYDNFQLVSGNSEVIFTSNDRPSLHPEHGLTFYNVTFTSPTTYAEVYTGDGSSVNVFNDLTFLGSAEVHCSNEYLEELEFSPGKTYIMESGKGQHLIGYANFNSIGTNGNIITILASGTGPGFESYIVKDMPHICINYVSMRDFHNGSPYGVIASAGPNSINWQNNYGWTFASFPMKSDDDCYYPEVVTICDQQPFDFQGVGPAANIVSWSWWFANGTGTSGQNPTTTFNTPGLYLVHCDVVFTNGIHNRYLYYLQVDDCCQPSNSVWPTQAGVTVPGVESGHDVAVDHLDNVYICGQNIVGASFGPFSLSNQFGFAASYDECGIERWAVSLPGEPIARRLKYTATGNRLYVITDNGANGVDLVALNATTGGMIWNQTINASGGVSAGSVDILNDDVYIVGTYTGSLSVPGLPAITSLSSISSGFLAVWNNGTSTWNARSLDPMSPLHGVRANGVAVHTNEHITVVGQTTGSVDFCGFGILPPCSHVGSGAYIVQFTPALLHETSFIQPSRQNYLEVEYDQLNNQAIAINGNTSPAFVDAYDAVDYTLPLNWFHLAPTMEYFEDVHLNFANGHLGAYIAGRMTPVVGNDLSMAKRLDLESGSVLVGPLVSTNFPNYTGGTAKGIATTQQGHLMYMTGAVANTTIFGNTWLYTSTLPGDYNIYTARVYEKVYSAEFFKLDLSEVDEIDPEATLTVSPNPTNGELNIEITLPAEEAITLQLIDFYGRVVMEQQYGTLSTQNVLLNLSGQASGIYYLQVRSDKRNLSQKVILTD